MAFGDWVDVPAGPREFFPVPFAVDSDVSVRFQLFDTRAGGVASITFLL